MAARAVTFRFCSPLLLMFLLVMVIFCIKRKSFCTSDGISITLLKIDNFERETYTVSSLFVQKKTICLSFKRKSVALMLLMLCGDIEICPGPSVNPIMDRLLNAKGVNLCHQNIRGLLTNFAKVESLIGIYNNMDILTLSETHITSHAGNDNNSLYEIPGYKFISKNRSNGKCGGVAMYVTDRMSWTRREDLENDNIEAIFIEVHQKNAKSFLVGSVYRPPDGSAYLHKDFNQHFQDMLATINSMSIELILLGDINSDFNKANVCKELKDIITLQGFDQLIKKPTRVTPETSTLIDVILTNNKAVIADVDVVPLSLSDHDFICCVRKLNHLKYQYRTITCRNYTKYDPIKMQEDLSLLNVDELHNIRDVNRAWSYLKNFLLTVFNKHAPIITKRVKGRFCPWLTADVKRQINHKDQLLRKFRTSKNRNDWDNYKFARNNCNAAVRRAKKNYHQEQINENRNNPRRFWKSIKAVFPSNSKTPDPLREVLSEANSRQSTANKFCHFFSNVARQLKENSLPLINFVWKSPDNSKKKTDSIFKFEYVSKIYIQKELKSMKRFKATGYDNLPSNLVKDGADYIAAPLAYIINLSLTTGVVPSEWKTALVKPLHKSGDKSNPDNYRPISILPVISKVLEKSVHNQLSNYLESNRLLSDRQFGYRKKRSTELATALFLDDIRRSTDDGKLTGVVYIDLSKAFDTLGHATILSKLEEYGISNTSLDWFKDYLFGRTQIVLRDDSLSDPCFITCGVPQGSILGPLLFLIFFNDFPEILNKCSVVQFADDTVIYVSAKTVAEIEEILNTELKNIAMYFTKNELIINLKPGKTESMLLGTAKRLSKTDRVLKLFYNHTEILACQSYKYLGTYIDPTLSLAEQFDKMYKKASSRLKLLSKMKFYLTDESTKLVYNALIQPILRYNCLLCLNISATKVKRLESLDRRANSLIPNLNTDTIDMFKKHGVKTVKKCLNGDSCANFETYFSINMHEQVTRNQDLLLKVPKVRLESTKSAFYYQGVKLFNSLPVEIRDSDSSFTSKLDDYKFS